MKYFPYLTTESQAIDDNQRPCFICCGLLSTFSDAPPPQKKKLHLSLASSITTTTTTKQREEEAEH